MKTINVMPMLVVKVILTMQSQKGFNQYAIPCCIALPCEGSRCTRKWFVKTSFAETVVEVGRRRRRRAEVRTRKIER